MTRRVRHALRRNFQRLNHRLATTFPALFARRPNGSDSERRFRSRSPHLPARRRQQAEYTRNASESRDSSVVTTRRSDSEASTASSLEWQWRKSSNVNEEERRTNANAHEAHGSRVVRQPSTAARPLRRQRSLLTVSFNTTKSEDEIFGFGGGEDSNFRRYAETRWNKDDYEFSDFEQRSRQMSPEALSEVSPAPSEILYSNETLQSAKISPRQLQQRRSDFQEPERRSRRESNFRQNVSFQNGQNLVKNEPIRSRHVSRALRRPSSRAPRPKAYLKGLFSKVGTSLMENVSSFGGRFENFETQQNLPRVNISRHELTSAKPSFLGALFASRKIPALKVGVAFGFVIRKERFQRSKALRKELRPRNAENSALGIEPTAEIAPSFAFSEPEAEGRADVSGSSIWRVPIPEMTLFSDSTLGNLPREGLKFKERSERSRRGQAPMVRRRSPAAIGNASSATLETFFPSTTYTSQFAHLLPSVKRTVHSTWSSIV